MSRSQKQDIPGVPVESDSPIADGVTKIAAIEPDDAARDSELEVDPDSAELTEASLDSQEDDDDFSLSQLSQAYTKLKRTQADISADAKRVDDDETAQLPAVLTSGAGLTEPNPIPVNPSTLAEREARDNAGCPISPASIVEAIVFVGLPGDEKLTLKKISSLMRDVSPKEIRSIVKQLNHRYENEQAAFRIVLSGEFVNMELIESMLPFQRELSRQNRGVKLNAATIEVLAIVAYNQPLGREKIDQIRKKPSGAIVSQLLRRGLIATVDGERSSQKQRLITTERFLNLFQLAELADLPQGSDVSDLDELLS